MGEGGADDETGDVDEEGIGLGHGAVGRESRGKGGRVSREDEDAETEVPTRRVMGWDMGVSERKVDVLGLPIWLTHIDRERALE